MRKKSINNLIFNIFFYLILLFPLLAYSLGICTGDVITTVPSQTTNDFVFNADYIDFNSYMNGLGLEILSNNIISTTIESVFGYQGIMPLFPQNSAFVSYVTYIVTVYILRLLLLPILFIPKFAIKLTDSFIRSYER